MNRPVAISSIVAASGVGAGEPTSISSRVRSSNLLSVLRVNVENGVSLRTPKNSGVEILLWVNVGGPGRLSPPVFDTATVTPSKAWAPKKKPTERNELGRVIAMVLVLSVLAGLVVVSSTVPEGQPLGLLAPTNPAELLKTTADSASVKVTPRLPD